MICPPEELTPSICGAALTQMTASDASLAGLIEERGLTVRDFMILSLTCNQQGIELQQLARVVGSDLASVEDIASRLVAAGLAAFSGTRDDAGSNRRLVTTRRGCDIVGRIVGD